MDRRKKRFRAIALLTAVLASSVVVGAQQKTEPPVSGQGTPGRVTKFTSATTVGDSVITENKFGQLGVGTATPTSRLTVVGVVESVAGGTLGGGFKFPDGSVQKSAGLSAGQITGSENILVTPSGNTVVISAQGLLKVGQAVTSLNGATGDIVLVAGKNITLNRSGNTIEIAAAPAVGVATIHDATLTGDGSAASPLGVAVPLALTGAVTDGDLLTVTNTSGNFFDGVARFQAGTASTGNAGDAVTVFGASAVSGIGGTGIFVGGGDGNGVGNFGGEGIVAVAGGGDTGAEDGVAGRFVGDVEIGGTIFNTGAVARTIDHPLDPENKVLVHAAVESSELLNVYSGNVTTDGRGVAVVELPDWFEATNADLRYQLTVVGTFARAIVAEEVRDNRFTVKTDVPNVKVSWQVTGARVDAAAKAHPFTAVEEKTARERGFYLTPEAFGQPAERGVDRARHPELMKAKRGTDR